jgi:hypothetical protein
MRRVLRHAGERAVRPVLLRRRCNRPKRTGRLHPRGCGAVPIPGDPGNQIRRPGLRIGCESAGAGDAAVRNRPVPGQRGGLSAWPIGKERSPQAADKRHGRISSDAHFFTRSSAGVYQPISTAVREASGAPHRPVSRSVSKIRRLRLTAAGGRQQAASQPDRGKVGAAARFLSLRLRKPGPFHPIVPPALRPDAARAERGRRRVRRGGTGPVRRHRAEAEAARPRRIPSRRPEHRQSGCGQPLRSRVPLGRALPPKPERALGEAGSNDALCPMAEVQTEP